MQTQQLARFICELKFGDIPLSSIEIVKRSLIDSLGCAASGTSAPWAQAIFSLVKDMGGKEESSIWFTGVRGPMVMVPMATATLMHAYWFDDVHGAKVHPGAVVIPAVLAASEAVGGISGKQLLAAIVAGEECLARVAKASDPAKMRLQGWQPSSICGSIGAATGAAKILALDVQRVSDTLGLSAGLAAGTCAFAVDGSPVEIAQVGSAAQRGMMSALMAQRGSWNSNFGLDAVDGGFCRLFDGGLNLSYLTKDLGEVFEMENAMIKAAPVSGGVLPYVEAAINLAIEHDIDLQNVHKVKVGVARVVELQCGRPYRQLGVQHAQQNLRYCISVAMFDRSFNKTHLQPKWLNSREIIDFIPKIETYVDSEIDTIYPAKFPARIETEMNDGSILCSYVEVPTGSKEKPLSNEKLEKKFMEQVDGIVEPGIAREIIKLINNLESIDDVTILTNLLA